MDKLIGQCPACKTAIGLKDQLFNKGIPRENDLAVCRGCKKLIVYGNDNKFSPISEERLQHLSVYEPMAFAVVSKRMDEIVHS